ncbi:hypothetical protein HaLaN_04826 [Haematococcus lacustris]|uniref:Uncharacterized protein n=1 Tax=Haematococcus lacustris TaxID=44745 RepID=A0A699YK49_HAELA|nr:hypothetical protein HaLaN_04826 [Haematococcus lacustris]
MPGAVPRHQGMMTLGPALAQRTSSSHHMDMLACAVPSHATRQQLLGLQPSRLGRACALHFRGAYSRLKPAGAACGPHSSMVARQGQQHIMQACPSYTLSSSGPRAPCIPACSTLLTHHGQASACTAHKQRWSNTTASQLPVEGCC